MTNEEQAQSSVPDKQVGAPIVSSDEQHRRLAIGAGVLLIMLASPCVLPVDGNESIAEQARHSRHGGEYFVLLVFVWPVCLGLIGFVKGLRRKLPGKILLGVSTAFTALQTVGGSLLLASAFRYGTYATNPPLLWLTLPVGALAVFVVGRSFFRSGWQRLNHLTTAIALVYLSLTIAFAVTDPERSAHLPQGLWWFLFAVVALMPFTFVTMTARRT